MQPTTVSTSDASAATKYSSLVRMDTWAAAQSVVQVNVTGTATFTVETSMDDPNSPTNPIAEASMTWLSAADTAIVAKSANAAGVLAATPVFVRLKQTAGDGSCTMTIAQFGNATY
jgi:hypothetical protein